MRNERLHPRHLLPCTMYRFVSARGVAGNEDKETMKTNTPFFGCIVVLFGTIAFWVVFALVVIFMFFAS